jgi:hypothetical protein
MRHRGVLILCAVCVLCAAGLAPPARAQVKTDVFDPSMNLEETVDWLGRQLTHVTNVATTNAFNGRFVRRLETRLVRAKGCSLSYSFTSDSENYATDSAAAVKETREIWTLDLTGLDPSRINVIAVAGREKAIWFYASPESRNAIRTSEFREDKFSATHFNRPYGRFSVRDEAVLPDAARAFGHAVELCRQQKR